MTDRPLRDGGAFVSLLAMRPLQRWLNRRLLPGEEPTAPAEIRAWARRYPRSGEQAQSVGMVRALSWFLLAAVALAALIAISIVDGIVGAGSLPASAIALKTLAVIIVFAGGAGFVGTARWSLSTSYSDRLDLALDRRHDRHGRPRGLLVRLCVPSNLDLVLAAAWTLVIAPALLDYF